jgi:hypothetical protein
MYGQQAITGVPELDAVLATAQMVTPDQKTPTVAAHVAQAAVQKLMPQGIAQGMNQVRQDVQAAMPSVARNAQEAQMRQALQLAMRPKPAGIEGLQSNVRVAEGGVVGYSGEGPSFVAPQKRPDETFEEFRQRTITEQEAVQQKRRDAARAKAEEERVAEMTRRGMAPRSPFSQTPPAPTLQAPIPEGSDRRLDIPAGGIVSPGMAQATPPTAPQASAPRPPAQRPPAPAQQAAPTGVAAALAAALAQRPTYDTAGIAPAGTPYIQAGEGDVRRIREAEGKRAELEKTLPDLSAKGIAALQQRMRDVETAESTRKEKLGLERVIQQLLGLSQGSGGAARADIQFMNNQRAAEDAFSQARLGNQQAQLLLEKAQQERLLGREDRAIALEKEAATRMEKARDDALKAKELAQRGEGAKFQGAVQMRSDDIQAATAAANRASNEQIARIQAAARENPGGKEASLVARVQQAINSSPMLKSLAEKAKFDPTAAAQYAAEEARLYQQLAPELLQNRPAPAPSAALKYNPATGKIE